jgi:hypothetical protein
MNDDRRRGEEGWTWWGARRRRGKRQLEGVTVTQALGTECSYSMIKF